MKKIILLLVATLLTSALFAHSGRTDQTGCHHDKKAGTRHCH